MRRIDLDYFYTFGRALSLLEESFALVPCDLTSRDWSRVSNGLNWLKPVASGEIAIIQGTQSLARDLVLLLQPLVEQKQTLTHIDPATQARIVHALTAFHREKGSEKGSA